VAVLSCMGRLVSMSLIPLAFCMPWELFTSLHSMPNWFTGSNTFAFL